MFCIKCGADNLETAKFCRKCGEAFGGWRSALGVEPAEKEEETRVASRSPMSAQGPMSKVQGPRSTEQDQTGGIGTIEGEGEKEIFAISPTLFFVKAGYVAAAVGALLLVGLTSAFLWHFVSVGLSVLFGLLLLLVPAYYHVRQKLVRYRLTESTLEIDSGFMSKTTRNVPLRRIQDVTVSATPWQRLAGIGDVVIDNASEEGGKIVLNNINSPKLYADQLLGQIRRLER